jgi:hypothetical protein
MVAIPLAKDTDAEDVAWGLQTAEALWKRGERIDAIVWLRRAAQAAGEAADDDRALELARSAAELSDWMATLPTGASQMPPPQAPAPTRKPPPHYDPHNASTFVPYGDDDRGPTPALPPQNASPTYAPQGPATFVPDGGPVSVDVNLEDAEVARGPLPAIAMPQEPRPAPPVVHPPSSPTMQTGQPYFPPPDDRRADDSDRTPTPMAAPVNSLDEPGQETDEHEPRTTTSVPPAERVHAGMFNPWDEGALRPPIAPLPPPAPRFEEEEEVITSVRPQQLAQQRADALAAVIVPGNPQSEAPSGPPIEVLRAPTPPPPPPPGPSPQKPSPPRPPPLPPRARKPPVPSAPVLPVAAAPGASAPPVPPPRVTPPPPSPTQVMAQPARRAENAEADAKADADAKANAEAEAKKADAAAVPAELDLDAVDAFSDLPDDARAEFAAAAQVSTLAEGEEVSGFALAYILSGTVDVAATMVDAPAAQLGAGAVLRSRGTMDEGVPMRLIGVRSGIVATWTDAEVQAAFRTCPWVEEDLRTAADRLQTLVGVTIGPLGERLDASIREQIIGRLTMRTLVAGDIVVTAGQAVPGLLLVGVGELELVEGDKITGVVGSGEFLFPGEVLGAGAAPLTARAGPGGALILFGDRMIAQELLVTCPPLLEVFAGM